MGTLDAHLLAFDRNDGHIAWDVAIARRICGAGPTMRGAGPDVSGRDPWDG